MDLGFKMAGDITREHARTFYYASKFLGAEERNAAYAVYAICRISDDSVDVPGTYCTDKIKADIDAAYSNKTIDDPLILAFRHTINKLNIPREYFDSLIKGIEMDMNIARYGDFRELYEYCYRVAGIVGLIMNKVFFSSGVKADSCAVDLGIAMQLTNILRDIKEDFARGRIYLPQDEMKAQHVTENDIAKCLISDNFIGLMKQQIKRAREYYSSSIDGIKLIPGIRNRFTVCLMKDIYADILRSIENNKYDVFRGRARVPLPRKLLLTLKVVLKREYL